MSDGGRVTVGTRQYYHARNALNNHPARAPIWALQTLILALFLLPAITAVTITAPVSDITAQTLPTAVNTTWDGTGNETYTTLLQSGNTVLDNTTTSATKKTYTLDNGTYTFTVTQGNASDTTSFSVSAEETTSAPPTLTISVPKDTYDTGQTITLTAGSDRPVTATLEIILDGDTIQTYTLNMQSTLNLIYIPDEPGNYIVQLSAETSTVTDTFTAKSIEPLAIDFTTTEAIVNKRATLTSTVTGGKPPYTYQWLFSDDTASTGSTAEHYFFTPGAHSATLVVTDAEDTQESITKQIVVLEETFSLEVTVRNEKGRYLEEFDVTITDEDDEENTKVTSSTGTVEFNDLYGNYTLEIHQISTSYHESDITMDRDRNLLFTINYTDEHDVEEVEEPQEETTPATQEPVQEAATEPLLAAKTQDAEQEAKASLEEARAEAKTTLSERKFNLQLSAKKDGVLSTLSLYKTFDQAQNDLKKAKEQDIESILKRVPKDVRIVDEQEIITYLSEEELEPLIDAFLEARGVQEKDLEKQYRHSIKSVAEDVSIRTSITQATIIYDGKEEDHTIIERQLTAPTGTYVVEVIPKTFAADTSKLRINDDHDILESDPIIRFNTLTYTYSAATLSKDFGSPIVVPLELQEPGFIEGLVTFKFGEGNTTRNIIYIALLGLFLAGLLTGKNVLGNRKDAAVFDEFSGLTDQALELIHNGAGARAATITPDILSIYEQLSQEQQESLSEVIRFLRRNAEEQHFLNTLKTVYDDVGKDQKDINAISGAYHDVLDVYEKLDEELKENLKGHIEQLDTYLDQFIHT